MSSLNILNSLIKKLNYKNNGKVELTFFDNKTEKDWTNIPFIDIQSEEDRKDWQIAIDIICSTYKNRLIFKIITDEPMKFDDYREKQIELLKTKITNYYDPN